MADRKCDRTSNTLKHLKKSRLSMFKLQGNRTNHFSTYQIVL